MNDIVGITDRINLMQSGPLVSCSKIKTFETHMFLH